MLNTVLKKIENWVRTIKLNNDFYTRKANYSPAILGRMAEKAAGSLFIHMSLMDRRQQEAIQFPAHRDLMLLGLPGSGKTLCLLHRAHFLSHAYNISPDRIRIFVFTNILKDNLKFAIEQFGLPKATVLTFDDWCNNYYVSEIDSDIPCLTNTDTPDFETIRKSVLRNLRKNVSVKPRYDFVLIDDVQDLNHTSLEIIKHISQHITACIGCDRQMLRAGINENEIINIIGANMYKLHLQYAYRCCLPVIRLATQLIQNPVDREYFIKQNKSFQSNTELPLLYIAENRLDEERMLIEIVKTRQKKGDKIGILLFRHHQINQFAKSLRAAGIYVESQKVQTGKTRRSGLKFNNGKPKIMTYFSAGGLMFDTVIMPYLEVRSSSRIRTNDIERMLFTGITRACKWVYMSACESAKSPTTIFLPLRDRGHVEVYHWRDTNG